MPEPIYITHPRDAAELISAGASDYDTYHNADLLGVLLHRCIRANDFSKRDDMTAFLKQWIAIADAIRPAVIP